MSPLETPRDANQLRYKALGTNLDDNYTDIHIRTYIFSTTHKGKKNNKEEEEEEEEDTSMQCTHSFMEDILYIQMTSLIYYAS